MHVQRRCKGAIGADWLGPRKPWSASGAITPVTHLEPGNRYSQHPAPSRASTQHSKLEVPSNTESPTYGISASPADAASLSNPSRCRLHITNDLRTGGVWLSSQRRKCRPFGCVQEAPSHSAGEELALALVLHVLCATTGYHELLSYRPDAADEQG